MSVAAPARWSAGTIWTVALLCAVTVVSWVLVIRDASSMVMPAAQPSLAEGARYTLQWGVMMSAMMLPSATPMMMLYRTVSSRLVASGDRAIPAWSFASVYLLAWLLPGIPLYLMHVAFNAARMRWTWLDAASPYLVATVLAAAGAYQFTNAKRACQRHCESPLGFLMRRWQSGYAATLRIATAHAAFCIGCCWGLMAILVVAGAMSLPWVLAISVVVLAEKTVPNGRRTAYTVGAALLVLAVAVAAKPELARRLSGMSRTPMMHMDMGMPMDMPM